MKRDFDWAAASGDIWARRWRDTDRALAPVGVALNQAAVEAAPQGEFDAIDIGCGPGATTLALASARPDARVLACDLSAPLIEIARERASGIHSIRFEVGDAVAIAQAHCPFDLFLSRHGVMFFNDPAAAFASFRDAARPGAALVFSCFQGWEKNAWASELASAAAGKQLPPPGREPSGFAFAEPSYVRSLLQSAGWAPNDPQSVEFDYIAGAGEAAADDALSFLAGPRSCVGCPTRAFRRLAGGGGRADA